MQVVVQYMEVIELTFKEKHKVDHPISIYAATKDLMN